MGAAGSILSAVGIIGKFVSFLTVIGVVVPPVAGIMIAEYFVVMTWRDRLDASRQRGALPDQPPKWNPACLFVWAISATAGYWVQIGIPALNSVLLAFLLYAAAGKLGLIQGYSRTAGEAQPQPGVHFPVPAAEEEARRDLFTAAVTGSARKPVPFSTKDATVQRLAVGPPCQLSLSVCRRKTRGSGTTKPRAMIRSTRRRGGIWKITGSEPGSPGCPWQKTGQRWFWILAAGLASYSGSSRPVA
jgi:hypothetical protein